MAFECPGGKWLAKSPGQKICPNCGRPIIFHRIVRGKIAERALRGLRVQPHSNLLVDTTGFHAPECDCPKCEAKKSA